MNERNKDWILFILVVILFSFMIGVDGSFEDNSKSYKKQVELAIKEMRN